MVPSDTYVTRLVSRLRALPETAAKQFLREAAADVCERAHCWRETVEVQVPANWDRREELRLPRKPPWNSAHVFRVAKQMEGMFSWTGNGFHCFHPFLLFKGETIPIVVEVSPDTQGMALEDMPEWLWNMAGNAILETAVARAASQIGRPWGDAAAYQTATRMAADEINRLVNTVVRAETRMRIYQPPPIGEMQ